MRDRLAEHGFTGPRDIPKEYSRIDEEPVAEEYADLDDEPEAEADELAPEDEEDEGAARDREVALRR